MIEMGPQIVLQTLQGFKSQCFAVETLGLMVSLVKLQTRQIEYTTGN